MGGGGRQAGGWGGGIEAGERGEECRRAEMSVQIDLSPFSYSHLARSRLIYINNLNNYDVVFHQRIIGTVTSLI